MDKVSEHSYSLSFGSTSTFDSLTSVIRKRYAQKLAIHKFTSIWEYIVITLGCTFTVQNFFAFVVIDSLDDEPTIIHHIICFIIVGLPLNYMQILIGQYSQLGVILFRHICPIGRGVGYAIILNSFMWCCCFGIMMTDFVMYLLACVDTSLNWMNCPTNTTNRCWDSSSNCTKNCITTNVDISAFIYWKEFYMDNVDLRPTELRLGKPMVERFVPLFMNWILIYFFVTMGIDKYKKIIRINFYLILTLLAILMFVCFLADGSSKGVELMFRINQNSLLSVTAWSFAIHNTIQSLALSRACHMMYGTYLTSTMSADISAMFTVFLNFFISFLGGIITHATMGITMHAASMDSDKLGYIWHTAPYFTVLIQGIGFMGAPQLWSIIYFLTNICIVVNNLITQVDAIEKGITDAHMSIRIYRNYIFASICILGATIGLFASSKEGFVIMNNFLETCMNKIHCFDIMIMSLLIFWIYGVQRLSDDIHFIQGSQPTKFWKIFWYMMPCFVAFAFFYFKYFHKQDHGVFTLLFLIFYTFFVFPIPLLAVYEVFRYLKVHSLFGILQPEERWGPPDPEERYLRNLFNPRQEIRSRRRDNRCQHNCLLGSKMLKKVILEEQNQRKFYEADEEIAEAAEDSEEKIPSHSSGSRLSIGPVINVH